MIYLIEIKIVMMVEMSNYVNDVIFLTFTPSMIAEKRYSDEFNEVQEIFIYNKLNFCK